MSEQERCNNRIEYIDTAKGVAILLVVFGHIVWDRTYDMPYAQSICNIIYSFHMPLFFTVSGICMKPSKEISNRTVKKMARAYIVPYVIWTIIYLAIFQALALLKGNESIIGLDKKLSVRAISICGLAPLWFLLALFIAELITIVIKPLLKKHWGCLVLIFLGGSTIGASFLYESLEDIDLITQNYLMGLLRILPTTFFVVFGFIIKDKIVAGNTITWQKKIIMVFILIVLHAFMCIVWDETIDVHLFYLGTSWIYFFKAITGIFIILIVSQLIHSKLLVYLGKNTKELMILHYPPFYWIAALRDFLNLFFKPNIFGGMIIMVLTIIGCTLINWELSKLKLWKLMMGKNIDIM
ncbi:MAG: acyltransferase family protein [Lachnospiraceae bacterium]|nr:acyltransferase family protein [Lachnospiraceae bacterium]